MQLCFRVFLFFFEGIRTVAVAVDAAAVLRFFVTLSRKLI